MSNPWSRIQLPPHVAEQIRKQLPPPPPPPNPIERVREGSPLINLILFSIIGFLVSSAGWLCYFHIFKELGLLK